MVRPKNLYLGLGIVAAIGGVGTVVLIVVVVLIRRRHNMSKHREDIDPLEECEIEEDALLLQAQLSPQLPPIAQGRP